ncbi:MAG: tRNA 2-thiocytidine biosynthesis TtcA family protein [Candidatus Cloacimonadales bacterium]|nr:tRNA 2-thiocytidine biosynthesis TtcA family protein [Candidatus Cloacimonadales bacterium]
MTIKTEFNKNFRKWFVNDVLYAIKIYKMFEPNEKICVALSGGKDSIALLYILWFINQYSWLKFQLSALHVKTAEYDTSILQEFCEELKVPYYETQLFLTEKSLSKYACYICSRLKRGAMSRFLQDKKIQKVAYGHHADDAAETFFMNMIKHKRLGSFSPKVDFEKYYINIIRPMIYLEEETIIKLHKKVGLPVLDYQCPHEDKNIRSDFKESLQQMNKIFHTRHFSRAVVKSLENIDWKNIWEDLKQDEQD